MMTVKERICIQVFCSLCAGVLSALVGNVESAIAWIGVLICLYELALAEEVIDEQKKTLLICGRVLAKGFECQESTKQ